MKPSRLLLVFSPLLFGALVASCEDYAPPPKPLLVGLGSALLSDPRAPLVLDFGVPIDPSTLSVKLALFDRAVEGELPDEDADPATELRVLASRDPAAGDNGVRTELEPAGESPARLRMFLDAALPVGPALVLLVEPGLRATSGGVLRHRVRIPFAYGITCASMPTRLPVGSYFLLLDVEEPIGTQIQLFSHISAEPATGVLVGQFTNADRDATQACPSPCAPTDVCRLLPAPECVAPSTRAATVDEHPDFRPNPTPPIGYSLLVQGCALDDPEGATIVRTAPAMLNVESPRVTVQGLVMTARFVSAEGGVKRAAGRLTADQVLLGELPLGPGKGSLTAIYIPDDLAPTDVPRPPSNEKKSP
jgi:hypothetical protein